MKEELPENSSNGTEGEAKASVSWLLRRLRGSWLDDRPWIASVGYPSLLAGGTSY
ncbi:MAG: hypothetical protein ACLTZT_02560 [Butyricimonas faecalis]